MTRVSWEDFARLASAPVTLTLHGRVATVGEPAERLVFTPPDLWRVEDDDGRLRYLATDTGHYQWRVPAVSSPASSHGGPATGTAVE